ncbi:helicase HerA-like C-terminal domain-containing protein [Brevundimonas aveniformis]|uniref:helicase HerA-like C-terminal domain-containing protein n=1 Tax=Brevundimonas aveniformis TaxID=370977 RepID=UPI0024907850|nr:helicase HerA-like C-terminal domain-containing protein [Brevundimonas aveniformis]
MSDTDGDGVYLGQSTKAETLLFRRANRHGVVAGATGTGKTVTLQIMAQGFSDAGIPVFAADVKGDLSGISQIGTPNEKLLARAEQIGLDLVPEAGPTIFWDLFGRKGHPIRTTMSEVGPLLLARMLELNDVQEAVLSVTFRVADDEGLLLLDIEDLRAVLAHVAENAEEIGKRYGHVAPATVAAIQRALLQVEDQGGAGFFGEPALQLSDLMRTSTDGRGMISVLDATTLINSPRLYSTFLLWLMSELFEQLPEVGDPDKPKLVFFFDEAHLLFRDTPKALMEKVEQVVRLIRSKGVGIYFVTQNPADIPDSVLAQLGNRIQHALRAYTPSEQRGLKAASESFRPNPDFDTATAIQELGVGEALVSTLDEKGAPTVVQKTLIRPPSSRLGPATDAERAAVMAASPVKGIYDTPANRESAHELLQKRANEAVAAAEAAEAEEARRQERNAPAPGRARPPSSGAPRTRTPAAPRRSNRQSTAEAFGKSVARSIGSQVGRALVRGILGSLTRR